jgi:hypothetical protein
MLRRCPLQCWEELPWWVLNLQLATNVVVRGDLTKLYNEGLFDWQDF